MNWEEVSAIGQVLGSVAVFITLGYLAVQVRHQRQETRRALSQERAEAVRELVLLHADEKTAGWLAQANAAFGTPENPSERMLMDKTGLSWLALRRLLAIEMLWWDFRVQNIPFADEFDPMERFNFDRFFPIHYGNGFGRFVYENLLKPLSHPDAVHYVDKLLAQPAEGTR